MNLMKLVLVLSPILFSMAPNASAQNVNAEQPTYKVGDSWQYEFISRRLARSGCQYRLSVDQVSERNILLRAASPMSCEVSLIGANDIVPRDDPVRVFDLNLNPLFHSVEGRRWLDFPLFKGKTWSQIWKQDGPRGWTYESAITASVDAYEEVTVPAGKFDAYKIRLSVTYLGTKIGSNTQSGRLTDIIWYAPAVKNFVKRSYKDLPWTDIDRELVSFDIQ